MINNDDLRLLNIKKEDELFYKHKIFVVAWQMADSAESCAKKLGISPKEAVQKAARLRHGGVHLKTFRPVESFPKKMAAELNKLAEKYFKNEDNKINPPEFVKVWQGASSVREVAAHFGVSVNKVSNRAGHYRDRYNIQLKSFRTPLIKKKGG